MLRFKYENALTSEELLTYKENAKRAYLTLISKKGEGNDFLGWLKWPFEYDKEEYQRIKSAALTIKATSKVLVVVGIGGSYLGAKAVIEALSPYFKKNRGVEVIFAGNTLSSSYLYELLSYLRNCDFSVNVISKSGTTTEPAITFRCLKDLLEEKYGALGAAKRIYATTDAKKGALRTQATELGYETFIVPDDIGGRYSVFTAVGLLPIIASGIDTDELLKGARAASLDAYRLPFEENAALQYAAARRFLYAKEKEVECLVTYEPKLAYISEWWKQLFGESEGKDNKGIFPASLVYSTDLHSMGQFIQDGKRIMFETVIEVLRPQYDMMLKSAENNLDGINYLAGKTLNYVNQKAMEGTTLAHVDGGVPNLKIEITAVDEYNIGYLLYFFMFSCGISCYMLGVNPFNQPGVESYKKNMFALLGKPGYEELKKELQERNKKEE